MVSSNSTQSPIINQSSDDGFKDHFCPFCNHKLFRGKVKKFNMVCSYCNKLVRSELISTTANDVHKES